jgi:hypothetical protein
MDIKNYIEGSEGKSKVNLSKIKTDDTNSFKSKDESVTRLEKNLEKLSELQGKLYAESRHI